MPDCYSRDGAQCCHQGKTDHADESHERNSCRNASAWGWREGACLLRKIGTTSIGLLREEDRFELALGRKIGALDAHRLEFEVAALGLVGELAKQLDGRALRIRKQVDVQTLGQTAQDLRHELTTTSA
jgi:hypothetical protein